MTRPEVLVASLDVHIVRVVIAIVILLVVLGILGPATRPRRRSYYR